MRSLLLGVPPQLGALGLGGGVGHVAAEAGQGGGRVAVLAGVVRQAPRGSARRPTSAGRRGARARSIGRGPARSPARRRCSLSPPWGVRLLVGPRITSARVRPERDNIAAPDLPEGIAWIGEEPELDAGADRRRPGAGPLPRLRPAQQRPHPPLPGRVGPPLSRRRPAARSASRRRASPSAPTRRRSPPGWSGSGSSSRSRSTPSATLWHAYGCEGWPSLFLWSLGGALSWFHFGEGEYLGHRGGDPGRAARAVDALRELPEPLAPLRPSDAPGARVMAPSAGGLPGRLLGASLDRGRGRRGARVPYEAGGAYATVEGAGEIAVELDGDRAGPRRDRRAGLYPLVEHPRHERAPAYPAPLPGLRIWSVSFAAGVP